MARLDQVAVTRRRQSQLSKIADATGNGLKRRWSAMDSHERADEAKWVESATPIVAAGQNQAISTQGAYLGLRLGGPVQVDRKAALAAAAVDMREPFIAFATALRQGSSLEDAVLSGALRAQGLGESAAYWAARAANNAVDDPRIVGWTRTLTGNACAWCVLVAGQTYKTAESASFGHQRCDCGVDPIIGDSNPGRFINDELAFSDS